MRKNHPDIVASHTNVLKVPSMSPPPVLSLRLLQAHSFQLCILTDLFVMRKLRPPKELSSQCSLRTQAEHLFMTSEYPVLFCWQQIKMKERKGQVNAQER